MRLIRTMVVGAVWIGSAHLGFADSFDGYRLVESFDLAIDDATSLPVDATAFDALPDGRLIAVADGDIWIETASGSRRFNLQGTLPSPDFPSFGAAFLKVSPHGLRLAVGNNGGALFSDYKIGVFDVATSTGVWFLADHFSAEWVDDTHLAVTAGDFGSAAYVTFLDTTSPDPLNPINPVVIDNIGGASGGITFDSARRLFTANGFSTIGPSGTGVVKAFDQSAWASVLSGASPLDFESEGVVVVDILSGSPLRVDHGGNLVVGGGDVSPDADFVGIVRVSAVGGALAGGGAVDVEDATKVRRLDPITSSGFNFYSFVLNPRRAELYVQDFDDATVYVYRDITSVPAVSQWGVVSMSLVVLAAGTMILRSRSARVCSAPACALPSAKSRTRGAA